MRFLCCLSCAPFNFSSSAFKALVLSETLVGVIIVPEAEVGTIVAVDCVRLSELTALVISAVGVFGPETLMNMRTPPDGLETNLTAGPVGA
jgi:predicted transcriptional regulator